MGSLVAPQGLCLARHVPEEQWGSCMAQGDNELVQLKLRFSERLRARIEAAAKKADRSMNSEIVRRLEQSFEREDQNALVQQTASTAARTVIAELMIRPREQ